MLLLGVLVWASTASWLYHQQRVQSREAIMREAQVAHQAAVQNCRALAELNREIRLTLIDAGAFVLADRFEDTRDCETLP